MKTDPLCVHSCQGFYAAIRENPQGEEWMYPILGIKEEVEHKQNQISKNIPEWDKTHPLKRIVPVAATEITPASNDEHPTG